MDEEETKRSRRSTRLCISIPVMISGVDIDGNDFSESVRTLIVNKHGGKIATAHQLAMGAEVLIENLTLGAVGKARVVWLAEKPNVEGLNDVGLQMVEVENVWGIDFPPDDWSSEPREESAREPLGNVPDSERWAAVSAQSASAMVGAETSFRLLQDLLEFANANAQEFHGRLTQLADRLGLEAESNRRARAASVSAQEVSALKEEIRGLRQEVSSAREEIARLEGRIEELLRGINPASLPATPFSATESEAQGQITALKDPVVEDSNHLAETGLSEDRIRFEEESQNTADRRRVAAQGSSAASSDSEPKS